jgi:hypothetical protein
MRALAAGVGLGVGAGCIGKSGSGCDAALPLIAGGLASEVLGLIGLSVDSAKRTTQRIPHGEVRGFGFVTRECARLPVRGVEVSLVPDAGSPASARTDDAGKADIALRIDVRSCAAARRRRKRGPWERVPLQAAPPAPAGAVPSRCCDDAPLRDR